MNGDEAKQCCWAQKEGEWVGTIIRSYLLYHLFIKTKKESNRNLKSGDVASWDRGRVGAPPGS